MEKFAILLLGVALWGSSLADESPCTGVLETRLIKNDKGCAYYFTCYNETTFEEHFCPDGFWFNEVNQNCDLRHNVPCTLDLPPPTVTCPERGLLFLPHEAACGKYIQCINGEKLELPCPDMQEFDPDLENCVDAKFADCKRDDRIPSFCPAITKPNQVIVHENVRSCDNYYVCTAGRTIQLKCAQNTKFVADKNWCDVTSDCKPKMPPGYPSITSTDDCPKDDDAMISKLPHPTMCSAYFLCFEGKSKLRLCAPRLKFDPTLMECNKEELVVCDDKPEPTL